jgi:transposase
MINVPAGARILLASRPIDFRKGAHGLAALAQEVLAEDPFSGTIIVYRGKRADRVKILVWDTSGLVLIWKQLQQGSFRWPPIMDGVVKLSPVEFAALFDGIDWTRVHNKGNSQADRGRIGFVRDRFGPRQYAEPA